MDKCFVGDTHASDVRHMMREACRYYKGHELSKIVKCIGGGRIYQYNGRDYSIHNCKDVCDLYEALFGIRPIAVKCADGKYVIYADRYGYEVRQKTIDLCRQILQEV